MAAQGSSSRGVWISLYAAVRDRNCSGQTGPGPVWVMWAGKAKRGNGKRRRSGCSQGHAWAKQIEPQPQPVRLAGLALSSVCARSGDSENEAIGDGKGGLRGGWGHVLYMVMSFPGSSLARKSIWATRLFAISSLTSVPRRRIRSLARRE